MFLGFVGRLRNFSEGHGTAQHAEQRRPKGVAAMIHGRVCRWECHTHVLEAGESARGRVAGRWPPRKGCNPMS